MANAAPCAHTRYLAHVGEVRSLYVPFDRGECLYRVERHGFTLIKLRVRDGFRGCGVGSHLVQTLQLFGRPIYLLPVADCHTLQDRLEGFYRRHGFRPGVTLNDYWAWNPAAPL